MQYIQNCWIWGYIFQSTTFEHSLGFLPFVWMAKRNHLIESAWNIHGTRVVELRLEDGKSASCHGAQTDRQFIIQPTGNVVTLASYTPSFLIEPSKKRESQVRTMIVCCKQQQCMVRLDYLLWWIILFIAVSVKCMAFERQQQIPVYVCVIFFSHCPTLSNTKNMFVRLAAVISIASVRIKESM